MWFLAYFLLHLAVYTLLRAGFLVWNWGSLKSLGAGDLAWAFLNGLRFDLSALAVTVVLGILGFIWLSDTRRAKKLWFWFFTLLNTAFFLINFGDIELFNFTAKRFSASSFFLLGDAHASNLILPYLRLTAFTFLTCGLYVFLAVKWLRGFKIKWNFRRKSKVTVFVFCVAVLFSRGGFQLKPITFVDAKLFSNSYGNNLVLNSTFTVLKSISHSSLDRIRHFSQPELLSLLNPQGERPAVPAARPNIVIVMLESFSEEYLELKDPEAAPYFNKLRKKSVEFTHAYANGRRSIEGVAAVLSGIPALMEEPFINSEFSANQVIGLGTLLSSQGYTTSFFHAANAGSMHFDSFTKSVGIDHHFSASDYPDQKDHDGTWGIYDEPFLQWTCGEFSEFKTPFFAGVFTLSSHQPYKLPPVYEGRFKDSRHDILKTIQYADYALELFMNCAEKQLWYSNTLFIFTADHTGPALKDDASFESRFKVPMVFFSPDSTLLKGLLPAVYAQHIDILPTLLDLLNMEYKNKNYLARSLLRPGPKVIALYADRQYQLVGDVQDAEKQLRAVQQYFSEGMYDNRLYYPAK